MGIDPGLNGGITILNDKGKLIACYITPTYKNKTGKNEIDIDGMLKIIRRHNPMCVGLEKQHAMPGQGVSSMFKIGKGYGILLAMFKTLDITIHEFSARAWQKDIFNTIKKQGCTMNTKELSAIVAKQIFNKSFKKSIRCTKAHDGMTDSALIARYTLAKHLAV